MQIFSALKKRTRNSNIATQTLTNIDLKSLKVKQLTNKPISIKFKRIFERDPRFSHTKKVIKLKDVNNTSRDEKSTEKSYQTIKNDEKDSENWKFLTTARLPLGMPRVSVPINIHIPGPIKILTNEHLAEPKTKENVKYKVHIKTNKTNKDEMSEVHAKALKLAMSRMMMPRFITRNVTPGNKKSGREISHERSDPNKTLIFLGGKTERHNSNEKPRFILSEYYKNQYNTLNKIFKYQPSTGRLSVTNLIYDKNRSSSRETPRTMSPKVKETIGKRRQSAMSKALKTYENNSSEPIVIKDLKLLKRNNVTCATPAPVEEEDKLLEFVKPEESDEDIRKKNIQKKIKFLTKVNSSLNHICSQGNLLLANSKKNIFIKKPTNV